jgi:hypothetical protein
VEVIENEREIGIGTGMAGTTEEGTAAVIGIGTMIIPAARGILMGIRMKTIGARDDTEHF